ncbi:MAG: hypothetical protein HN368_12395, partial [Spirochaetales bacterium]|nr:hypothetical protein [Spirochaetales bacterium]
MSKNSMAVRPPVYLGGTVQNACTMIRDPADDKIRHFFRKGSWDTGFSSMLYSVEYTGARSGARSGAGTGAGEVWNREREVVDTGDDTLAQAFLTISPVSKEILLFNLNRDR